jgi:hypothetical protein
VLVVLVVLVRGLHFATQHTVVDTPDVIQRLGGDST